MKKAIEYFQKRSLALCYFIFLGTTLNAQVIVPAKTKPPSVTTVEIKKEEVPTMGKLSTVTNRFVGEIKVYEFPNYQGRSANPYITDGKLRIPFPGPNFSFTFSDDLIIYIKTNTEFYSETAFVSSQPNIRLDDVIDIRADVKTKIWLQFNGISTSVHNNDCKKVFGDIKTKVFEISPRTDAAQSFMTLTTGSGYKNNFISVDSFTFVPFHFSSSNWIPVNYYTANIFNNNPEPFSDSSVSSIGRRGRLSTDNPAAGVYFFVGKRALMEGRVKMTVSTKLGSAHKNCDLCDDYSSNISMKTTVNEVVPIDLIPPGTTVVNTKLKKIVLGPYEASGKRDRASVTASAGIVKEFRVYFFMKVYDLNLIQTGRN